ncbi:MAG: MerR family transcriptional regulator [Coriobacteriales bacterium]|jgi:DNA-binding transcriptional MerR regulator|nr:MerR family transcriptional regulator [Coriobacteriales bacterium]
MIKQNKYSIQEVEQFLGIPRTKIRHYMDKGLLDVQKDDQSGYYFYCFEDLMRLCQIVYYRERLGFSMEKVEQLLQTSDFRLLDSMTKKQLDFLNNEIAQRSQQRKTMIFNRKMIDRQQKFEDTLTVIPFDTVYLVPYAYYFFPNHEVYPIIYGASEFCYSKKAVSHVKKCCLVFEEDAEFVEPRAFKSFLTESERVEGGMCIYSSTLTHRDVHDPSLLQPALDWAAQHRFSIKGRIFLTHFFPYYAEGMTYYYVETFLPINL